MKSPPATALPATVVATTVMVVAEALDRVTTTFTVTLLSPSVTVASATDSVRTSLSTIEPVALAGEPTVYPVPAARASADGFGALDEGVVHGSNGDRRAGSPCRQRQGRTVRRERADRGRHRVVGAVDGRSAPGQVDHQLVGEAGRPVDREDDRVLALLRAGDVGRGHGHDRVDVVVDDRARGAGGRPDRVPGAGRERRGERLGRLDRRIVDRREGDGRRGRTWRQRQSQAVRRERATRRRGGVVRAVRRPSPSSRG